MTDLSYRALREAIMQACLRLEAEGLNQGTSGNVSARIPEGFLITPSGMANAAIRPEDIVRMDLDGGYYGDVLPSSEWMMHSAIYRSRHEAGAIVHTHSTNATALSCMRLSIPPFHYLVALAGGKDIRCSGYAPFGTAELSLTMLSALEDRKACLLANHGMICFEANLDRGLMLAGEVETLAKQYRIVLSAGTPVLLSDTDMETVIKRISAYRRVGDATADLAFVPPERRD